MASIRVVLRKKKNSKGQYPINIRVTKNRKSSFISTGQFIDEKYWDTKNQKIKKSHPNSARLNNFIAKKLAEINDKLLEVESNQSAFTAQAVTDNARSRLNKREGFFGLTEEYLKHLEDTNQLSRLNSEKPRINHFRTFLKNKEITFQEITPTLLKKFQAYLRRKRNNGERSIVNALVIIRTIYNSAINEGIIDRKYYPFGKGGIVIRFPESMKLGLSQEELNKLEEVDLTGNPKEIHARNVWLFSFYFAGMRASDVLSLRWSDIREGRLYYQMNKNNKTLSLKIPDRANNILSQYEGEKRNEGDYVFPELKKAIADDPKDIRRKIKNGNKTLNIYLAKIASKIDLKIPLTMHIARHTFGNLSGDRIPIQMLQKLYRHSDITTTINYQKSFINQDTDDALETVLNGSKNKNQPSQK